MVNEQIHMPEVAESAVERGSSLLDSIKNFLKPEALAAKFHEWKYTLLDWGIYLGVGFIIGLLIKKYLKYILLLILFVVALVLLEQFDILQTNINWAKMQELFNIQSTSEVFDARVVHSYIDWVKVNFALVLSATIGFILGLKVG
jgi:uncharacterized membrane protein (Fun14 family)